ncbi:MAG: leucyl/phenylalanyl-tRNA--protein transferase [Saprospiraceae bacterium]|nr:leucyl/phenylalanyl-tRNA--protein transferase [Candidatus Opimibacter skivensis]
MPVYSLDDELIFPHPILREPDGLMAVGGDLSPERLLLAYRWGIFPWYHEGQPILWWWLAPRLMVRPGDVHISHSVRNYINQKKYKVTFDQDFTTVMQRCSSVKRVGQEGTWIMPEMIDAYTTLHQLGYAHSVEVWEGDQLVGGLYGIALGKIFFGESMFAEKPNASKVGFVTLAQHLDKKGFLWIDCQQDTPHMRTLGADLVEEDDFLAILRENHAYIV